MGSMLKAVCKCGFSSEFGAGAGMSNFKEFCAAPAICHSCKLFVVENYLAREKKCPKCSGALTFYNDLYLQAKPLNNKKKRESVFHWNLPENGVFILPDTLYLCPSCGKFKMKIQFVGCFD